MKYISLNTDRGWILEEELSVELLPTPRKVQTPQTLMQKIV